MQHTEPPAVERSLVLYRRLMRAYPPAFREQYGDEMARVFRDAARAAWRGAGFAGMIALWARTLADTAVSATHERVCGSEDGVKETRWQVLSRQVRTTVVQMLPVIAFLAIAMGVMQAMKDLWLPALPSADRGWAMSVWAILLGLLSGSLFSRAYRVPWWKCCIRWIGFFSWLVWLASSDELGLDGFWADTLPFVPLFSVLWTNDRNKTHQATSSDIGREGHLPIAVPALLLLLLAPAPYLATNVFLGFVVVVNGVAALPLPTVLKARK